MLDEIFKMSSKHIRLFGEGYFIVGSWSNWREPEEMETTSDSRAPNKGTVWTQKKSRYILYI